MKALFLTVGDYNWASSRIRSYWPAEIMPNADAMQWKEGATIPDDYDAYIWMKTGDLETMKRHKAQGKISFVEVCDPNWWWQPDLTRALLDETTAIVAASPKAADDIEGWYGDPDKRVYVIPDRLKLDHYPMKCGHGHVDPVRFIWYGVAVNRISLFAASAFLDRLAANGVNFELTIFDNAPDQHFLLSDKYPIYHTLWSLERENEVIAAHDIALLPPYPGPWDSLKTNNKMLTAWACGLPVTSAQSWNSLYDLATLASEREAMAQRGMRLLIDKYDVRQTAEQWQEVLESENELR